MIKTLKFIKLFSHENDQADKDIAKFEYENLTKELYAALDKFGYNSMTKKRERQIRDHTLKEVIQQTENTLTLGTYFEIISNTDDENVKNISILLPENGKEINNEISIIHSHLKNKLQKLYSVYNTTIANSSTKLPFVKRDGKLLFDDEQFKLDKNSVDKISDNISSQISKALDIILRKI